MEIVKLTISQLVVDKDFNVREARNYGDLDALAEQISQDGQLNPIQVGPPTPEGKYPVVAGFRRVAAIRKLNRGRSITGGTETPVFAVVIDKEEAERAWVNLTENLAREDLTGFERAKGLARLVGEFGWKPEEISNRFGVSKDGDKDDERKVVKGMSRSNIANLVASFQKLSPKCMEAWSKGQIGNEAAFALKSRDHEEQDELIGAIKGKNGVDLVSAIKDFDAPPEIDGVVGEGADDKKKKRSKPGANSVLKALAWAKEQELNDVVATLQWMLGRAGKKLKVGGQEFDPKAKVEEVDDN